MKVKAIVNHGTNDYGEHALLEGQEGSVPESVGRKMVARGHAVDITPLPPAPKQQAAEVTEKPKAEPPKAAAKLQPSQKDK